MVDQTSAPSIVQQIVLEGDKAIKQQLDAIGAAGQRAFDKIKAAGANVGGSFSGLSGALDRVKASVTGVGSSMSDLGQATAEAGTSASGVGSSLEEVGAGAGRSINPLQQLTLALRALGRLGGAHAFVGVGKSVGLIGRSLETLAAPAVVALFGRIATSSAAVSASLEQNAQSLGTTTDAYQKLTQVGTGAGVSQEDFGKILTGLKDKFKESAAQILNAAKSFTEFRDRIADIRTQIGDTVERFSTLNEQQAKLDAQSAQGKIGLDDYSEGLANVARQRLETSRAISKMDEQQRREEKAFRDSRDEADRNANAITKLGFSAAQLKDVQKELPTILERVAEAFKNYNGTADKTQMLNELLGDKSARLKEAFEQGAAGIAKFRAEGERIAPALSKAEIATGTKLSVSVEKLGDAFSNLFAHFGTRISPAFIDFFDKLTNMIVDARPAVLDFADSMGKVLGPVLTGIVDVIKAVTTVVDGVVTAIQEVLKAFGITASKGQIFAGVLTALVVIFGGWPAAILAVVVAVRKLWEAFSGLNWNTITTNAAKAWDNLKKAIAKKVDDILKGISDAWNNSDLGKAINSIVDFFSSAFSKTKELASQAWNAIVEAAGSILSKIGEAIGVESIKSTIDSIVTWFSDAWKSVSTFATDAWNTILGVWNGLTLANVATMIQTAFGQAWQWISDQASQAWQSIKDAWNASTFGQTANAIIEFFSQAWSTLVSLAGEAWQAIVSTWNASAFGQAINAIVSAFTAGFESIKSAAESVFGGVLDKINNIIDAAKQAWSFIQQIASGGSGGEGFAQGGGPLKGPGTSTSDSIPIWASAGEFIVKAAAVRKYGPALLHAINSMRLSPSLLGFSHGGLAPAPIVNNHYAKGGLVDNRQPFTLKIGQDSFPGLFANEDAVTALQRYALNRNLKGAGRKPSWT